MIIRALTWLSKAIKSPLTTPYCNERIHNESTMKKGMNQTEYIQFHSKLGIPPWKELLRAAVKYCTSKLTHRYGTSSTCRSCANNQQTHGISTLFSIVYRVKRETLGTPCSCDSAKLHSRSQCNGRSIAAVPVKQSPQWQTRSTCWSQPIESDAAGSVIHEGKNMQKRFQGRCWYPRFQGKKMWIFDLGFSTRVPC